MFFQQVLSHFPLERIRLAVAYGSGVFQQFSAAEVSKNMVDFIFVVDNSFRWHQENLSRNWDHYSFMRLVGPKYLSLFQDRYGARVYYNTLINCEGRLIKYGTIERASLINDLLDWETLYVSGRLHKPVNLIHRDLKDTELTRALDSNLRSAIHASLLILPERFSEEALYSAVTGLSYTGDFRMSVGGENKNKVRNIVRANMEHFRGLYESILSTSTEYLHWNRSLGRLEQSACPGSRYHHLNLLPKWLMFSIVNQSQGDGRHRDTEEVLRTVAHDSECANIVQSSVRDIVKYSSLTQTVKGIMTAGLVKSVKYSASKLSKGLS